MNEIVWVTSLHERVTLLRENLLLNDISPKCAVMNNDNTISEGFVCVCFALFIPAMMARSRSCLVHNIYQVLTHWGWVTHICINKLTIIGSDNGLSPDRPQAIIWTNAVILLIWAFGTNFGKILIEIHEFSFKNMHFVSHLVLNLLYLFAHNFQSCFTDTLAWHCPSASEVNLKNVCQNEPVQSN